MEAWFCGLHQGQNIMLYLNSCSYVIVKRPGFLFPKRSKITQTHWELQALEVFGK